MNSYVLNKQCQSDLQFREQKACNRQIPGQAAESAYSVLVEKTQVCPSIREVMKDRRQKRRPKMVELKHIKI